MTIGEIKRRLENNTLVGEEGVYVQDKLYEKISEVSQVRLWELLEDWDINLKGFQEFEEGRNKLLLNIIEVEGLKDEEEI